MRKSRLAINCFFFVNGFLYANWVARLPKYQELYSMDNGTTGLVLLGIATGALIAMPFTGWLIFKNGSNRITAISGILMCIVLPFTAILGGIVPLAITFFFFGINNGIMDVAMNAQAVVLEEQYQRPIMSSFHAIFSGGMMIGAGTAAIFTKSNIILFYHLLIVSLFSFCVVLWSIRHLVVEKRGEDNESEGAFQLPTKAILGIGTIAFCCMLGEGAMADWTTNYMLNIAQSSEAIAPLALGSFSGAMMLGRIVGDTGREKFGDKKLLIGNSLVALFGLLLFVLFPIPIIVIAACFLVGLGLSVIVPIAYSRAGSMKGIPAGVGISMVTTIGYAGFLFGPPIIGFLADWYNLRIAIGLIALLFVIMTILSFRQTITP